MGRAPAGGKALRRSQEIQDCPAARARRGRSHLGSRMHFGSVRANFNFSMQQFNNTHFDTSTMNPMSPMSALWGITNRPSRPGGARRLGR